MHGSLPAPGVIPVENGELRRLFLEHRDDVDVAKLIAEVLRQREELREERRRCAELAAEVCAAAGAKIREDAQRIELELYAGYHPAVSTLELQPSSLDRPRSRGPMRSETSGLRVLSSPPRQMVAKR
jgi:hypothetical protein